MEFGIGTKGSPVGSGMGWVWPGGGWWSVGGGWVIGLVGSVKGQRSGSVGFGVLRLGGLGVDLEPAGFGLGRLEQGI
jgi:hypothetical protein